MSWLKKPSVKPTKSQEYEETLRRCNLEQLCYCFKTKWQSSNECRDPSVFSCKQSTVLHCQSHCPFVTEREVWQHRTDSHRPPIHKTCVRISQGFSTQHAIQEFSSIKLPSVISFVTTDESLIWSERLKGKKDSGKWLLMILEKSMKIFSFIHSVSPQDIRVNGKSRTEDVLHDWCSSRDGWLWKKNSPNENPFFRQS